VPRVVLAARDLERLAVIILERNAGPQLRVLALGDALARQAGDLVELLRHGDAFDDVAELHDAGHLGQDRHRERIPLRQQLARLDAFAFTQVQARAVGEAVALALAARLVGDHDLAVAVHDDPHLVALDDVGALQLHDAVVARLELWLLGAARTEAADGERPHRQLRAGLADRLGGDDAD